MAKKDLFTPEDFDKEPRNSWKKSIKWVVIGVLFIIAVAVGYGIRGCKTKHLPQRNPISDSMMGVGDSDSIADVSKESSLIGSVHPTVVSTDNEPKETRDKEIVSKDSRSKPLFSTTDDETNMNVEKQAIKVIRGEYGNNPYRKATLGENYLPIQDKVNELKREGVF